jgi:hypothetical protein
MKFDVNKITIGFIVVIALITLIFYSHKVSKCSEEQSDCVCSMKTKLETSFIDGKLDITPYTYKYCEKVTK